ncbi:hypothetical protein E3N88_37033 [Mikania micrantha]|uniref:C2 domain-containing protein n=1 Tax=Mikania micrantha TaxID=192012 RepID=A0A5N6M839_9ASTR|nr:hypothetical protein E3N88_37033 [Mikania micrantha]
MPEGTLEVLLVSAKGLHDTDILSYFHMSTRLMHNDCVGKGSNPQWKETFLFDVSSRDSTYLKIKIMDSDGGMGADDFVGHGRQFSISLDALFQNGDVPPKSYNIMKDDAYCGEIRIGLNFTAQNGKGASLVAENVKLDNDILDKFCILEKKNEKYIDHPTHLHQWYLHQLVKGAILPSLHHYGSESVSMIYKKNGEPDV